MKLQCQVEVVNRLHNSLNFRSNGKYVKSTLVLGQEPKSEKEYFILHFSSVNKTGNKYRLKSIKQLFIKFIKEGKATIRFEEPPHDLCIKSEVIQLTSFIKLLRHCATGDTKGFKISTLSNLCAAPKIAPTKLFVRDRSEIPTQGFPRTLQSLHLDGLKLCNFRRDILLLKHLVVLHLSNNEIEKLPSEFGMMPSLLELYVANNKLGAHTEVDWRWLLGPKIIKSLKLLDLSGNQLKTLPKAIWKLQTLVTLKVDNNLLEKLPATLGRMSSLRYLTVSRNNLQTLPCSLMQCRLEHLDISKNKFDYIEPKLNNQNHKPWDFCIGNLVHLSSKVVLKHKIFYSPKIIPWTLVEFLDDANMCLCGAPVVNDKVYAYKEFELKQIVNTAVFDQAGATTITFECYFCSSKCLRKWFS